ncbi:MAG: rod shape-determining protein MreC [Flammeovirgaceae bacterium]|nr:rod shape-determining protein MreC [Flammeovirgaceae bacterium]
MNRIFLFIYNHRTFFTFIVLEVFCTWLIIQNNQYQGAAFFNSSNQFVAGINSFSSDVRNYFALRDVNQTLAEENVALRKKLEQYSQQMSAVHENAAYDSNFIHRYDFVSARVISNSVDRFKNYFTINKGARDSVKAGMAVISEYGAIGKVKITSKNFSVVSSLLNTDVMVSALVKRTGHLGSAQWDGDDANCVYLNFIPRHVKPIKGDTITTSGYNAVFPENILIGVIDEVGQRDEEPFLTIRVKLAQDFRKLSYVAVVKSTYKQEIDSLQHKIELLNR